MGVGWKITRKGVERFVTTVVNQLTHVACCLRRMNVACVHRVIVLAVILTVTCTVIKVDLHGGHLFSNATYKAYIHVKGHHIAMASACGGFVQRRTFLGARTSTNVNHNGWSSSWIARWVASRAGQLHGI